MDEYIESWFNELEKTLYSVENLLYEEDIILSSQYYEKIQNLLNNLGELLRIIFIRIDCIGIIINIKGDWCNQDITVNYEFINTGSNPVSSA